MAAFADIKSFEEAKQLAAFFVKKYKKGIEVAGFSDSKTAAEAILRQVLSTSEVPTEVPANVPVSAPMGRDVAPMGSDGNPPPMLVQQVAAHLKGLSESEKDALVNWENMAKQTDGGDKLERFESRNEAKLHEENMYLKQQIELLTSKLYGQEEPQKQRKPAQQLSQPPSYTQHAYNQQKQQQQQQQALQPPDEVPELETTLQGLQRRQEVEKYILSRGAPLDEASSVDDDVFERTEEPQMSKGPQAAGSENKTVKREELRKAIDDLLKPTAVPLPSHPMPDPVYTQAPVTAYSTPLPLQALPGSPHAPQLSDTKAYFWEAYNREISKAFPNSPLAYQPQPASFSSPLANHASLASYMSSPKARKQGVCGHTPPHHTQAIMSPPITPSRPVF